MQVSVKDLIRAGFHFGHRTSRWNPSMKPYIFKKRNQIHIIDLRATMRGLITASKVAAAVAARGRYVMFVGTKRQGQDAIKELAEGCDMPFVAERWPGGLLTNYVTIRQRLDRLDELEHLEATGEIDLYSKKMISSLRREKRRILRNLGGVRKMDRQPGLLVIVDPNREKNAVNEAVNLGIPVIALTDTDGNPKGVDIVVPGNDDSLGAIELFLGTIAKAVRHGKLMNRPMPSAPPASPPKAKAAPAKAAPVEAAPTEEAPVEAAPAEEAPVEAAPVEEAPVEVAPTEAPETEASE